MATEAIAVAIMVDSSLALASLWPTVLITYISPLLTRLVGNRTNTTFNIAFVTYAMADTRPTPLVTLRYFAHPHQVTKEFKEDPQKLGIGRTGGGGRHGMAVLEGYVAAIELFDVFTSTRENDHRDSPLANQPLPPTHCQIIHVACSSPDLARLPLWNQNSELDNVSWKTLPDELRKRNINLSMILLRPDNTLSEFHKHVVSRPDQPWFPVRPGHNVLLSGFPAQAQAPAPAPTPSPAPVAVKRPVASPVPDRPAEVKRARPNVPQPSPTPAGPSQPQEPEKVPEPSQAQPPAPVLPAATAPRPPNAQPPTGLMAVVQRMHSLDAEVKTHYREMQEARQSGRTQDEENARKQMQMKLVLFNKLKAALQAAKDQQQVRAQAQAQAQEASGSTNQAAVAGNTGNDVASQSQTEVSNKPAQQPPPPPAQNRITPQINAPPPQPPKPASAAPPDPQHLAEALELMRSKFLQPPHPSQPSQPPSVMPSGLRLPQGMTPEVAAQMQKLLEQQRGRSPRQPHLNAPNVPPVPPVVMQQPQQPPPTQPQAGSSKPIPQEWYGALTWTGIDSASQTRMEVSSHVVISGPDTRKETWPPNLTLTPSSERAVPTQDLHVWIKRFAPKMCTIVPNPRSGMNEQNFKSLNNLLVEKSLYALASWDLPSTGKKEVMMVIFPFPNPRPGTPLQLVCAVFPDTGVPELPRVLGSQNQQLPGPSQQMQATPSINPTPLQNPTPTQAMPPGFANWPNEMKTAFFTRMMSYRQTQAAQQQQQQQAHQLHQQQQGQADAQQLQHPNAVMGGQAMAQHSSMNQFGGLGQGVSSSPPNVGGFMGGVGMNATHPNAGGFHPMGAGGSGGGISQGLGNMQNLSLEMLQSFMQRNPDGMGGPGQG